MKKLDRILIAAIIVLLLAANVQLFFLQDKVQINTFIVSDILYEISDKLHGISRGKSSLTKNKGRKGSFNIQFDDTFPDETESNATLLNTFAPKK